MSYCHIHTYLLYEISHGNMISKCNARTKAGIRSEVWNDFQLKNNSNREAIDNGVNLLQENNF